MKGIYIFWLSLFLLFGCSTFRHISKFSNNKIELGITQQEFVSRYGKPYTQEITCTDNVIIKKLLYKESLYIGSWYVITTAFIFENERLVKQEVIKEVRQFQDCNCRKTD